MMGGPEQRCAAHVGRSSGSRKHQHGGQHVCVARTYVFALCPRVPGQLPEEHQLSQVGKARRSGHEEHGATMLHHDRPWTRALVNLGFEVPNSKCMELIFTHGEAVIRREPSTPWSLQTKLLSLRGSFAREVSFLRLHHSWRWTNRQRHDSRRARTRSE